MAAKQQEIEHKLEQLEKNNEKILVSSFMISQIKTSNMKFIVNYPKFLCEKKGGFFASDNNKLTRNPKPMFLTHMVTFVNTSP